MVNRKRDERDEIAGELMREGIKYEPMVASDFGSLAPGLDNWVTALAKACGRRRGWAAKAVDKQIRNRLGACFSRRSARMSLATWGRDDNEGDIILPIIEYEDYDRTPESALVEPRGTSGAGRPHDPLSSFLERSCNITE